MKTTKTEKTATPIKNRYEALLLIDVQNGNPNGDPDNGGKPRVDAETGHGRITDVCLKRKVRDYVCEVDSANELYVKKRAVLQEQQLLAYQAVGMEAPVETEDEEADEGAEVKKSAKKSVKKQADLGKIEEARAFMAKKFWDIRAFGAVYAGKDKERALGNVMGPLQVTMATSIDPIRIIEDSITRVAVATTRESLDQQGLNQTMGRKYIVPYGLYAARIFVSPRNAERTKFSEEDLNLFWSALDDMWDHDRSAGRGFMAMRKLIVFKHASALGNANARDLFNRIQVTRRAGVEYARSFEDYDVRIDDRNMPGGVELMVLPRITTR
jgi:CRISPR-associated protein Csd2